MSDNKNIENPKATKAKYYLSEGSHVEVLVQEKGLQNTCFPATVIEPPKPSETSPSSTRRTRAKDTAKVRYTNIMDSKGELLVETTSVSSIRPAPPEDPKPLAPIEPYEVVDVLHKDVWWRGYAVRCDVDGMYVVVCDNPPDVLRVRRSDLRLHWDYYLDDPTSWVRPQKEKVKKRSPWYFTPSMEIEYDFNKEKLGTTWRPAIYVGKAAHGLHYIKYSYEEECFEALHGRIRPCPSEILHGDFDLSEMVEAFCDPLWIVGVVRQALQGNRYIVALMDEKKEAEFEYSQLRPHREWANGRWDYIKKPRVETPKSVGKRTRDDKKAIAVGDDTNSLKRSVVVRGGVDSQKKQAGIRDDNEPLKKCIIIRNDDEPLMKSISIRTNGESPAESNVVGEDNESVKKIANIDNNESTAKNIAKNDEALTKYAAVRNDDESLGENFLRDDNEPPTMIMVTRDNGVSMTNVNKSGAIERMPFTKCSSLWKNLEEMDVYKRFHQNPNFLPLEKFEEEEEREGLAIGQMVNFANLVRRISNLQQNVNQACVESIKERLVEYEHLGFEVKEIRDILDQWLGKKMDWEGIECMIWEKTSKQTVLDEELEKTNEQQLMLVEFLKKIREKEAILMDEDKKVKEKLEGLIEDSKKVASEVASLKEEAERKLESGRGMLNFLAS